MNVFFIYGRCPLLAIRRQTNPTVGWSLLDNIGHKAVRSLNFYVAIDPGQTREIGLRTYRRRSSSQNCAILKAYPA